MAIKYLQYEIKPDSDGSHETGGLHMERPNPCKGWAIAEVEVPDAAAPAAAPDEPKRGEKFVHNINGEVFAYVTTVTEAAVPMVITTNPENSVRVFRADHFRANFRPHREPVTRFVAICKTPITATSKRVLTTLYVNELREDVIQAIIANGKDPADFEIIPVTISPR